MLATVRLMTVGEGGGGEGAAAGAGAEVCRAAGGRVVLMPPPGLLGEGSGAVGGMADSSAGRNRATMFASR